MRRWYYWGVLLFAWVLQGISIYTWPKINEINREFGLNISSEIDVHTKEDLFSVILFKPFHYLVSILFTFFFLLLFRYVLKKMIYECKVAYLLRSLPYEPAALLTVGILLYGRAFYHFPYTTILFSFALIVYELGHPPT